MNKQKIFQCIIELGMLAVIRGPSEEQTLNLIDALVEGGVLGIEITFSTPNACSVVESLEKKYGEKILIGMGTITQIEQVSKAKDSGAKFLVTPMFDEDLTNELVASGLITMIGSFTTSEIFHAHKMGADIIKIFPGRLAGPNYLKDLRGPFPDIPFIPTGGVDKLNIGEWFKAGAIAIGVGSNLCPKELVRNSEFKEITRIAREYVEILNNAR